MAVGDATATQSNGQIAANTGVIAWFQYSGNTYVIEAINTTSGAAAHTTLTATDEVVKIVGLVKSERRKPIGTYADALAMVRTPRLQKHHGFEMQARSA